MQTHVFRYRPHIKWFQYIVLLWLTLFSVTPSAVSTFISFQRGNFDVYSAFATLFFGVLTLWLFFLFRTMASTQLHISEGGLRYVNYRKDITVGYDEITGLGFPALPYLGGWLKIKTETESIRLTVVLEDIDEAVRILKERLDETENSEIYNRKKLFGFYKTAGFSSQSWERFYTMFIPILGTTIAAAFVTNFTLAATGLTPILALLSFGIIMTPLCGWALGEFFLLIRFIRNADEAKFLIPDRHRRAEQKLILAGYGVYALGGGSMVALLTYLMGSCHI